MKTKRLYIVIFLILHVFFSFGQSYSRQNTTEVDTSNAYALLSYSKIIKLEKPAEAFDHIQKALEISLAKKDKKAEGFCYLTLGELNKDLGIYDISVRNYQQAIEIFKSINNVDELLLSYKGLGDVFELKKEYEKSKAAYDEYLRLSENLGSANDEIQANKAVASSSAKLKDYDSSIDSYKKVKKQEAKRKNSKGVLDANNKIGEILVVQEKQEEAIQYFEESQAIAEDMENEEEIAESFSNLGKAYRANKEYDKELDVRQKSITINEQINNSEALTTDNYEIGELYLEQNQAKEAIPYIEKSIEYSKISDNLEKETKAQKSLSRAFAKDGDYDKALESYQEFVVLQDSIFAVKEKALEAKFLLNSVVLDKQRKIDLLEKNKTLKENEIIILKQEQEIKAESLKNQQILIYSLIALVLLLVVSALLILKSYKQKQIANQMLALKSLRSQMNPHFIFNALNSVNSFISTNDERSANKYLADFSKLMRSVLDNSEHSFIPLSTEVNMLKLYLTLEHFRFKDKFEYQFDVSEEIDLDMYEIPPMLIQPYIENSIWHGLRYKKEKGELNVSIDEINSVLNIVIEDNGIGRRKSQELKTKNQKNKTSTGIKSIDSRLEILNSAYKLKIEAEIIDIDENEKVGTKVIIKIPQKPSLN